MCIPAKYGQILRFKFVSAIAQLQKLNFGD